jgi:pimeloyl-ACP methyl ester carboxylesterase
MRKVIESRRRANGIELALFEWPGEGPEVFFAHATGFHARCWDQVIAQLPGFHCWAIDMRGHGRSDKPAPPYPWRNFGEDVAAVANQAGIKGAVGVGHSKGGHAVTLAAAISPELFSSLLLVDPVILPRSAYVGLRDMEDHFAARRRNTWASPEEMFERFKDRPPFNVWEPAVLKDYCDYGLLPAPEGEGYVLACPPEIEAATYAGSASDDIYEQIATVTIPVRILRARERNGPIAGDMSGSPTNPDLASHFANAVDMPLPQYTHFMPMQDPGFIAAQVKELAAQGTGG